ncbi:phospholipase A-2-activating protein [Endogone sp. FLAS-F59071]|nr:phospholipase A-2-activating protein [Endogone sp. FLAS-F59071]|eukprot:RUS16200.1 phospholipase A-2-activating protein [Endogone sp. FLAS-F59071]
MASQYKLSATLQGHELDVRALYAPTNDLLLSAARDKTVRSWIRSAPNGFVQDKTYLGHTHFVNALAFIPASAERPQGLIVSSGSDKVINIYDPNSATDPVYSLVGHKENVCTLAVSPSGYIVSGSWDKTIKVWKQWQEAYTLEGHSHAVWSVLALEDDLILSASADKTIRLWKDGKCIHTYRGHTDVVRDLALVPGIGFLSCSNDSTLRLWSLSGGESLQELGGGHTSFIYSIAVLPSGEYVSSGEDRTVRVWRDGQLVQTIPQPCISVWTVAALPNGDIACGGSDSIVRVFTRHEERVADSEALKFFDEAVASHAIPSNQVGDVNKEKLPGIEALQRDGTKEGQVLMIRVGNTVEAYQWNTATRSWQKVGEVVDAIGSDRKQIYQGKEYDHVFDIDIGDGQPVLKLPFNITENPWNVAQNFIWRHELPQGYLDQIANFITQNASAVNVGSSASQYADPLTGAARYTPAAAAAAGGSITSPYADPLTGPSAYRSAGSAPPPSAATTKIIPQEGYLTFKHANLAAIQKKIVQVNTELGSDPSALPPESISKLEAAVKYFQNPANVSADPAALVVVLHIASRWPVTQRFPGLDFLRLYALHAPGLIAEATRDQDGIVKFVAHAAEIQGGQVGLLTKEQDTNLMLALRVLVNLCDKPEGREIVRSKSSDILTLVADSWHNTNNKNTRLAWVTLLLNISVLLAERADEDVALQVIGALLEVETDPENVYRALVAAGTLMARSAGAREAAVILDAVPVLQNVQSRLGEDTRVRQVIGEIVALFQ